MNALIFYAKESKLTIFLHFPFIRPETRHADSSNHQDNGEHLAESGAGSEVCGCSGLRFCLVTKTL